MHQLRALAFCLIAIALTACGVNPVTGKKEIQFVSEAQELQIGEQNYSPTRQSEGGEFVRMDLPKNPGNYLAATGQFDSQGRHFVVVQNRSPVALTNIQVTPVLLNDAGQIVQQGAPVRLSNPLKAGEQAAAPSGIASISQAELSY